MEEDEEDEEDASTLRVSIERMSSEEVIHEAPSPANAWPSQAGKLLRGVGEWFQGFVDFCGAVSDLRTVPALLVSRSPAADLRGLGFTARFHCLHARRIASPRLPPLQKAQGALQTSYPEVPRSAFATTLSTMRRTVKYGLFVLPVPSFIENGKRFQPHSSTTVSRERIQLGVPR